MEGEQENVPSTAEEIVSSIVTYIIDNVLTLHIISIEEEAEFEDDEEEEGDDEEEEDEEEEEYDEDLDDDEDNEALRWGVLEGDVEYHDAYALELAGENKYDYNFCYNYAKLCSKPYSASPSVIPNNLLTLHATYGYACEKLYNLIALDSSVLAYLAGNYVALYNFKKHKKKYLRSLAGTGLSAIAVDSDKNYFVVGERGNRPTINVFMYPSFVLLRMLKNGAEKQFSYLDFNSDSTLLASLGGEPDYTLAIWDWKREMITWRSKAFSQDVYKVSFSTEFSDKLITSGVGHIKFWTMADTFTGCKLQGVMGKFGHVELSDIRGFTELSGDRTISGSEWGNILLWEDGMCVAEITRKGKTCHEGSIEQIVNDNGSILTVGIDGVIRVWDIEERISERNSELFKWEMDPLDEMRIGKKSELTYVVKVDKSSATDTGVWLAQDRNGRIWMIDLSFQLNSFEPRTLMSCHGGAANTCVSSPMSDLFATGGDDCTIRVYDYMMETQLSTAKYNSSVTSMIWLPMTVDPTGGTLVAGFRDGVVRMIRFQMKSVLESGGSEIKLCDVIKPHNESVTRLSFHSGLNLLASGSRDKTVFFFTLSALKLRRIGFVQTEVPVTYMTWVPRPNYGTSLDGRYVSVQSHLSANLESEFLLVSCEEGKVIEFDVSQIFMFDNSQSYQLSDLAKKEFQFRTRKLIKEETPSRASERREHTASMEEAEEYEEEEEEEVSDGSFIEEERETEVSFESVLFALYNDDASAFWISVDGPNGGYLHECTFDTQEAQHMLTSVKLSPANGTPVRCHAFHSDNELMMFGAGNGTLLAYDFSSRRFDSFLQPYSLAVLDSKEADISDICLSYDESYLFIAGQDGNIFSFKVKVVDESQDTTSSDFRIKAYIPEHRELPDVEDITDSTAASLEDSMMLKRLKEAKAKAEESKKQKLETLRRMQKVFKELTTNNVKLPPHLRIYREEFQMDASFEIESAKKREEMLESARRQLLFDYIKADLTLSKVQDRYTSQEQCSLITVKALTSNLKVSSYRTSVQPLIQEEGMKTDLKTEADDTGMIDNVFRSKAFEEATSPEVNEEIADTVAMDHANLYRKLRNMGNQGIRKIKLFEKVEAQRMAREKRKQEWNAFLVREPKLMEGHDSQENIIREAKHNLGDMKLKTAVGEKVTLEQQKLTLEKSSKALSTHMIQQNELMDSFNVLLMKLRDAKSCVIADHVRYTKKMEELKVISPETDVKLPVVDARLKTEEYPEWKFSPPVVHAGKEKVEGVSTKEAMRLDKRTPTVLKLNELENSLKMREKITSKHEQMKIVEDMTRKVKDFDACLSFLRSIKFSLDVYFKQGALREMLLLQEKLKMFEMLQEEEVLIAILNSKLKDELEFQKKIDELTQKIERCHKELTKFMGQQNQLEKTFMTTIPENYKFTDFLVKVYKQKVKRRTQDYRSAIDDDDEDDLDDFDDEEEYDDDEDNFDDDDDNYMNLDVCPEGCNIALYEKTIQMREYRLDILERITENKKIKEAAGKELEVKKKIAKTALEEAAKATLNLDLYQVAKLKAVNEFFTVVLLTLRQIEFVDEENEGMAFDSAEMLVVDLNQIKFLERRIQQLESENQQQLKSIKETQEKHLFLTQSKSRITDRISSEDEEVKQAMKRKFGKMVNMEKIESILVSPALEELMYDFDLIKLTHLNEISAAQKKINQKELELSGEVKLNTDIINYTLAYKDVAAELALDLSRNQEDTVAKKQANPVKVKETLLLVERQALEIFKLKHEKYKLIYCPSLIKRF